MSDIFKCFVFYIVLTVFEVTGIDFTINRENVLLGSTGILTLRCDITETDVETIYNIQIKQLRSSTLSRNNDDDWQRLAFMKISTNDNPTLDSAITPGDKDYVAGGSWDSTTPANTELTLSMNMEKLVCDDARTFKCDLSYYSNSQANKEVSKNSTFTAYVKPQVTSLITRKNGFIVEGMSSSDMATAEVGDELELTCTGNIGSLPGTIIRWHRTSATSHANDFIGYQPPQGTYDEGTAISDNQCGYKRVASIRYNVTAADANRDNNLAFECYVTVSGDPYPGNSYTSENNPRFYTDVNNPSNGVTDSVMSTTDGNGISITAGVIAGIVIGSLIVGAVILAVLKRKRAVTGRNNQHQPTSVSREIDINVSSLSLNTYEQLQNRTDTESRMIYDSLDASANSSGVPHSESQYESLKQRGGTSHTYAGLNQDR
ncbi:uncharacterized protein LOC132713922 [Ruditapes philippinarum]|uniref:uncharacterized protein LOC132713922 n=1 Tax=Ruditapes philippinarum TaxID=129788 RepID=UPI00295A9C9F|nr:uncharacterized protein LOC132713922 [Ruditapes philippinarum]